MKAAEDGYINIAFDNGYNGFCIRYGKDDAKTGDSFTISNMELAINNNTGENISEHLKILFVKYFDTFFQVDTTTNSCTLTETIATQHTVWAFSDDFNIENATATSHTTPTPSNPSATPDSTLNTNSNATENSAPKTGDLNYVELYVAIMFISLATVVRTFYMNSKQQ